MNDAGVYNVVGDTGDSFGTGILGGSADITVGHKSIARAKSSGTILSYRIDSYAVGVTFEDNTSLSNYLPSADLSSKTTKTFAWKFKTAFGSTVPTLRIMLYNAVTGFLLDDDDSVTQSGTWEKTTDGTTWGAYNTTDKGNETTFIRFTPNSIPGNLQVRAVITLL